MNSQEKLQAWDRGGGFFLDNLYLTDRGSAKGYNFAKKWIFS